MLVTTSAMYANRPLRADESDYGIQVHRGILKHGVPMVTVDDRTWFTRNDPEPQYGLAHPPLYQYALAAIWWPAPTAVWPARLLGVIFLAAALGVGFRLMGDLAPDLPASHRAFGPALAILAPFVTEGALHVDIDGGLLILVVLIFLRQWVVWRTALTPRRVVALMALFVLALSAKMTSPVLAIAACGIHAVLERRPRALLPLAAVTIGGGLIFAALYLLYCAVTGYPPDFMLEIYRQRQSIFTPKPFFLYALAIRWHLAWLTVPLALLLMTHAGARVVGIVRARTAEPADLLWIFAATNAGAYIALAAYWGKYMGPGIAVGLLGAALWLLRAAPIRWRRPGWFVAALGALALFVAFAPLTRVRLGPPAPGVMAALSEPRVVSLIALGVIVVALAAAARAFLRSEDRLREAGIVLACCAAVAAPIDQGRLVLFGSDGNGPLRAGIEEGLAEVRARLIALPGRPLVLAPKELAYAYPGPSYVSDDLAHAGTLNEVAARNDVRVIVDSSVDPWLPAIVPGTPGTFDVEAYGTWRIYRKR